MQEEGQIWRLMARVVFKEADSEEENMLQNLLRDNPDLQQQFYLLSDILQNRYEQQNEKIEITNSKAFSIIQKADRIYNRKKPVQWGYKKYASLAAASVILLIIASLFFFRTNKNYHDNERIKPAFATANGSRKQITLPDGSRVWLNAGSNLYYITNFEKTTTREVKLEGEAFFDVAKNPARPFIVHAGDINIKALGTTFNVKAYQDEPNVETTLYSGLVNITKNSDKKFVPIMLYPNQKIIVPIHPAENETVNEKSQSNTNATIKSSITIQQIDSTKTEPLRIETAWIYNRLEFRGDDFIRLAHKLERWYNVKIVFADENVKQLSFNGSFEKENIEQAMLALSIANSFNYKIQNDEIIISSKN
jgi:ferric-dicitrate binding protein FerR (iron transport regulator)